MHSKQSVLKHIKRICYCEFHCLLGKTDQTALQSVPTLKTKQSNSSLYGFGEGDRNLHWKTKMNLELIIFLNMRYCTLITRTFSLRR
jgi:hypothetical protein